MIDKYLDKYHALPVQAKTLVWFFLCSVLQKGVSTLTTPLFTRLLSPSEYGEYALFNSWSQIISIIVTLNIFAGGYMQGLVRFDKQRAVYSSSMQGLTLALVSLWTVIYVAFREYWNGLFSLTTFQMSAMLLIIWASAVFQFWAAEQRVLYRYRTLVAITLAMSILTPATEVFFIFYLPFGKVDARILGQATTSFLAYLFLFISQIKKGKKLYSGFFWKYALTFNIPMVVHYLSQVILSSSDRIMIERMIGVRETGIYSLAYSISMVMVFVNTAIEQSLSPWMYKKIKQERLRDMRMTIHISSAVVAAANLMLICFAPEIVAFFAPPDYYEAVRIIPPIAMSVFFIYMYAMFAKVSFYQARTMSIAMASTFGAILNIVLNLLFIPIFGYQAAGYTTLICYMTYSMVHYLLMRSVCKRFYENVTPCRLDIILLITFLFMSCGFLFLSVYEYTLFRFGLLMTMLAIIFWKKKKVKEYFSACLSGRT